MFATVSVTHPNHAQQNCSKIIENVSWSIKDYRKCFMTHPVICACWSGFLINKFAYKGFAIE